VSTQEQRARAYCHSIGANPDAMVSGVNWRFGHADRITQARWRWYVGAVIQQQHAAE
jgi:hypothetical protein